MVSFLVMAGIWAAVFITQRLIAYANRPEQEPIAPLQAVRAQEGVPVPVFWGRVRVTAPSLIFHGNAAIVGDGEGDAHEANGNNVLARPYYRATVHLLIGIPGGDDPADLVDLFIGETRISNFAERTNRQQYSGETLEWCRGFGHVNESLGILTSGLATFYSGTWSQTISPSYCDVAYDPGTRTVGECPSFRGQAHVILSSNGYGVEFWNGAIVGYSPELPPYGVEIIARCSSDFGLGTTYDTIGIGSDANPACVLYSLLTDAWAGLGLGTGAVDAASFAAAAATLEEEQHGFSMILYNAAEARTVIEEILRQTNGVLYEDPTTQRLVFRLVRADYDVGDLESFDDSNIIEVQSVASTLWSETYNQVRVVYEDRNEHYREKTAIAQDAANILSQGKTRSITYTYKGIKTAKLARAIAVRDLADVSIPVVRIRFVTNRDAAGLRPGDPFLFTSVEQGITNMVCRVQKYDLGELGSNRVIIEAAQDRFAPADASGEMGGWGLPFDQDTILFRGPAVITERKVMEAPNFFLRQTFPAMREVDPERQRLMYLPVQHLRNTRFGAAIASPLTEPYSADTTTQAFRPTATVHTAYSRTREPYDVDPAGLKIENLSSTRSLVDADGNPVTNTAATISEGGAGLILVGDEIMAFEAWSEAAGVYTLTNVWRGLLDTAPVDHAVAERVYFLSRDDAAILAPVGLAMVQRTKTVGVKLLPYASDRTLEEEAAPVDTVTVRARTLLPLPGADLTIDGAKADLTVTEPTVVVDWKARERTSELIIRGDEAAQTTIEAVTYDLVVVDDTGTVTDVAGADIGTAPATVAMAPAAFGDLRLGLRSVYADPGSAYVRPWTRYSWQIPTVTAYVPDWRNLLVNGVFAGDVSMWVVTNGTLVQGALASGPGGVTTSAGTPSSNTEFYQIVDVRPWAAAGLTAICDYYDSKNTASVNDVEVGVAAVVEGPPGTWTIVGTESTSTNNATQNVWNRRQATVARLPADTEFIRVRVDLSKDGEISNMRLLVGQASSQLLTFESFEAAGSIAAWNTNGTDFNRITSGGYDGAAYLRGGSIASASCYQVASVPTGYGAGCDVVLDCVRWADAANPLDTGKVTLTAYDGATVIGTTTTGTENYSQLGSAAWAKRTLHLRIPTDKQITSVRVDFDVVRSAGAGICYAGLDACALRIFRTLQDAEVLTAAFATPVEQVLPTTLEVWEAAFPTVIAPNFALWPGTGLEGVIATMPLMEAVGGATLTPAVPMPGLWSDDAIDAITGVRHGDDLGSVRNRGVQTWANFDTGDKFAFVVAVRVDTLNMDGEVITVLQRLAGGRGWALQIQDTGYAQAVVYGASGTVAVAEFGASTITDGATHLIGIHYDASGAGLTVIVDGHTASDATAPGTFATTVAAAFTIGEANPKAFTWARIYGWKDLIPSVADLQSIWTHGGDPTALGASYSDGGGGAYVVGTDAAGNAIVATFAADAWPTCLHAGTRGVPLAAGPITNLISTFEPQQWTLVGGATRTLIEGPDYRAGSAALVTGTSAIGVRRAITGVTAATPIRVAFMARSAAAQTINVVLRNNVGTVLSTQAVAVTATWARYDVTFPGTGVTTTCDLNVYPSTSGTSRTLDLWGTMLVAQGLAAPALVFPPPSASAWAGGLVTLPTTSVDALPLNHQGEIRIDGVGAFASSGTDAPSGTIVALSDSLVASGAWRKQLAINAPDVEFDMQNAAGTLIGAVLTPSATIDWLTPWTLRGRWDRLDVVDDVTAAAQISLIQGPAPTDRDDTTGTWTPATTTPVGLFIGGDAAPNSPGFVAERLTLSTRAPRGV